MPSPAERPGIANATHRQAYSSGASHGKVIARLVPDYQRKAADACRDLWAEAGEIDLTAPEDRAAEAVSAGRLTVSALYLLDTNILIASMKSREEVRRRLSR